MDGAYFFLRVGRRTVEQLAAAVKNCHFQPQGIADGGDKTFNERADHFQVCHKTVSFPKGQWREFVENLYKLYHGTREKTNTNGKNGTS